MMYSSSSSSGSETEGSPESSPLFELSRDAKFYPLYSASDSSGPQSHRALAVLTDHAGSVSSLALCGDFILSASQGNDIIVWQKPDMRILAKLGKGDGSVKAMVVVGNKLFTAHQDSRIRVWKISRRSKNLFRLTDTLPTTKDCMRNFIKQINFVQTGRHHERWGIEHTDGISCLAVYDGLIYSGSWDNTIKVWRITDLKCLESINAHDDAINEIFASKAGIVYSASADGTIKTWGNEGEGNSSSHYLNGILEGHRDVSFNTVVVSDDGEWVYGGGSDGFVMSWEDSPDGWKLVSGTKTHQMAVLCMCLAGEFICTGSTDKSIGIWKREAFGKLSRFGIISGHEGPIRCLQASPASFGDGFMLYSGSFDKSLRVWRKWIGMRESPCALLAAGEREMVGDPYLNNQSKKKSYSGGMEYPLCFACSET
ncbi:hypothetical protein SAY87_015536 [Trapa incisa]|uniref:Uncharacterized protein n=1 Tax=Trapa incisa TaxID=236973 RepID=A0AAN7GZJ0_9MYRT|nr:hypothetical protein SAY87_015536 [Trapa incisa]